MPLFSIFHAIGGNYQAQVNPDLRFKYICTVEAPSLPSAFVCAQNEHNIKYAELRENSTSVGDIIYDEYEEQAYMIKGLGFDKVNVEGQTLLCKEHS